jgi:transposase
MLSPRVNAAEHAGGGMAVSTNKRRGVQPTHEWDLLLPLFEWPEQERYEQIRPLVLFDASVAERAAEIGTSTSTLYRRRDHFAEDGMESLFDAPTAKRKRQPLSVRRLILDLKAEYPRFNLNEIANVVHACFGRKPDVRSVERVLEEEPLPLRIVRNYPPYHETEDRMEGRAAIVELRLSGWSVKVIAGYLGVHHATVYRTMEKWKKGGMEGLLDRPFGRPPGVRKADFAAVEAIRKLAQNPGLGAFRVHAALEQMGFDLSRATCGRILAQVREVYGYEKPIAGGGPKKAMVGSTGERNSVRQCSSRGAVGEGLAGPRVELERDQIKVVLAVR